MYNTLFTYFTNTYVSVRKIPKYYNNYLKECYTGCTLFYINKIHIAIICICNMVVSI